MDRRQFVRAVSILCSCGFSPTGKSFAFHSPASSPLQSKVATSPDTKRSLNVGIVAIGSTGNLILNRLNETLPQLYRCVAVEGGRLTTVNIDENKCVVPGSRWPNNTPVSRGGIELTADQIAHSIKGLTQLFVLTEISGSMELEVVRVLAEIASRENILMIGAVCNHFGYPKACGRPHLQDWVKQLLQLRIPSISLCGARNIDQQMWAGETILEQLEAAATFERLYRSTVLTQDDGNSLVWLDRESISEVFSQRRGTGMVIGYGSANGPDGAQLAACRAVSHPLFNTDRERSDIEVLVSIEAGPSRLKLREVRRVLGVIGAACPYCVQIVGAFRNPLLKDSFHVTVVGPEAP